MFLFLSALFDTDFSTVLVVAYYEIDMVEAVGFRIYWYVAQRKMFHSLKHVMYINMSQNARTRTNDHLIPEGKEKIFHVRIYI